MAIKVRVIFDGGKEFTMECESAEMTRSTLTGELTNFEYNGCTKNRPLYLNLSKVIAVVEEEDTPT